MNSERAFPPRLSSVLSSAALLAWIVSGSCPAQSPDHGFGALTDVQLPERFERVTDLRDEAERAGAALLVWTSQSSHAALVSVESLRGPVTVHPLIFPMKPLFLLTAPLTTNGTRSVMEISASSVIVFEETEEDSLVPLGSTPIPFVPSLYCIADLNNDGKTDLAIATKNEPGIVPLYGNGKGLFRVGKTIAPEAAVGSMVAVYLNNDFLVDLVVYDWLKSEIHALYGVGRGRFLDQSTFPIAATVTAIESLPSRERGVADLVLTTSDPATVQVWNVNDLGDFKPRPPIPLSRTTFVRIVEQEGTAAMLWADEKSVTLSPLQDAENSVSIGGTFGALDAAAVKMPDNSSGLVFLHSGGDSLTMVASIGPVNVLAFRDSLALAPGSGPAGLLFFDADRNGTNDIIVTNTRAASVSVFSTERTGGIVSQTQIALDATANELFALQSSDTAARLLFANSSAGVVASSLLQVRDRSTESNIISTPPGATVVYASRRSATVEFGTELRTATPPTLAYSYYRQLNESQFLEETFRLPEPYILTGGAFGDVDRDGYKDFLALFHHPDSSYLELAATFGDSALTMKQVGEAHETGLPISASMLVWLADLNADDTLDLVCLYPERKGELYVLFGTSEKNFLPALMIASGIPAVVREDVVVADCNNDKYPDLVVRDPAGGTLSWWKNSLKRSPAIATTPMPIGLVLNGGKFALGDINGDGIPEIAVTDTRLGRLIVYNGKRRFQ